MKKISKPILIILVAAFTLFSLIGCVSGKYKKEVSLLKEEKWDLEQKNFKLENDVIQMNYRCELLIKELQKAYSSNSNKESEIKQIAEKPITPKKKYDWFANKLNAKGLEVVARDDNPAIVISDLFNPGSITLSESGKKKLKEAGKIIKSEVPAAMIRIDGYTDNIPIQKAVKYASNTDLSLARAKAVKAFLTKECRFKEDHISVRGLGEKDPIADNKNESGKKKNRRVELVVILNS